ncbi:MAG: diaminopimelate epimerase [Candidatus Omnitrophica bacterium]|nr:diaminopimelate epimerase [Candidatus Omnitrophota bacterium]
MKLRFIKLQAGGNDFILIDNRKALIKNRKKCALKLCRRQFSIGADGLLLLENSKIADFRMRIYNPDGTEAEMCGNGIRCLIRFICLKKLLVQKKISIETADGIYSGKVKGDLTLVKMKEPKEIRLNLKLRIKGKKYTLYFINLGVPHTVLFVDDLEKVDMEDLAPSIRDDKRFFPLGTNVDFVKIVNYHSLKLRTYERGVEAETLSCGTGAAAAAIISYKLRKVDSPVKISPSSGESLKLYFDTSLMDIYLEGKATKVYEGECSPNH